MQLNGKTTKGKGSKKTNPKNFVFWFLLTSTVSSPLINTQSFTCKKIYNFLAANSSNCPYPRGEKTELISRSNC